MIPDNYLSTIRRAASPAGRYLLAGTAARTVADLLADFDPPPAWRRRGTCGTHVDLFDTLSEVAPDAESPAVDEGRRVCAVCPVRTVCLLVALLHREEAGMWGGLMPAERDLLVRRRSTAHRPSLTVSDLDPDINLAEVLDETSGAREGARLTGMDKEAVLRWRAEFAARLDGVAA